MHDYLEGLGDRLVFQRDGSGTHDGGELILDEGERDARELAGGSRDLDGPRRTNLPGVRVLDA